jgi:hypothetical protein
MDRLQPLLNPLKASLDLPKTLLSTFQRLAQVKQEDDLELRGGRKSKKLKADPGLPEYLANRKIESYLRVPPPTAVQLHERKEKEDTLFEPSTSLWSWYADVLDKRKKHQNYQDLDGRIEGMNWDGNVQFKSEGGKALLPIAFD